MSYNGETLRYYRAEISVHAGLGVLLHQVGIVFRWQHFYCDISVPVGADCSKHMCFLFKILALRAATVGLGVLCESLVTCTALTGCYLYWGGMCVL